MFLVEATHFQLASKANQEDIGHLEVLSQCVVCFLAAYGLPGCFLRRPASLRIQSSSLGGPQEPSRTGCGRVLRLREPLRCETTAVKRFSNPSDRRKACPLLCFLQPNCVDERAPVREIYVCKPLAPGRISRRGGISQWLVTDNE